MNQFTRNDRGFTLLEVMIAMVILAFSMLGVMGLFQWSEYGSRQGTIGTRALAMAQGRIETKRTASWEALLTDDLNLDGIAEIVMHDDGLQEDVTAGDGIFTANVEQDGIRLVWTVQLDRVGPITVAGSAVIQAKAMYSIGHDLWRHVKIGTLRANPSYIGFR